MLLLDHAGRIALANVEAERLFGYARDELLGRSVETLLPEPYRDAHVRQRAAFLVERTPRRMGGGREIRALRKDGHEFSAEIGLARIDTPEGVFILATLTDVGERKRAWRANQARTLAHRLVQAEEAQRKRIAREIHDSLGQSLTALKLGVGWLAQHVPDEPAILHLRAIEMEELAARTIDDVRRLSAELRPAILDDQGLLAAIRWQVGDFERRCGLRCTVALPDAESALGTDRSTAVFRVLQESLTNVARHAQARRVDVTLRHEPRGDTVLQVCDDGCGFIQERVTQPGALGLLGMRERAQMNGGSLTVTTAPGMGTTVTLRVPREPHAIAIGSAPDIGSDAVVLLHVDGKSP
jgi:PAS domain S-box-containing protein